MQTSPASTNVLRGIALMTAAMLCFAAMNVGVRHVATHGMHSTQMVFLRNVLSWLLISAWIAARHDGRMLRTARLNGHLWRAGLGCLAMEAWFYSLSVLPLTLATALSFTTPVFATLFAMWLLKEKAGWRRWCAIAVSFAGVLLILRPDAASFNADALWVLLSSGLMAIAGVIVKSLTRTEPPETIVFYMAAFMTPLSLVPALAHWQPVLPAQWAGLAAVALFSTSAHLLISRAYAHAEMVVLLPLDFTRLLFTGFLAWIFFNETLDGMTLAGASVIMASAVYIVHREAVRRKPAKAGAR